MTYLIFSTYWQNLVFTSTLNNRLILKGPTMNNKTKFFVAFYAVCLSASTQAAATDEMGKDDWLAQVKTIIPAMICKGFNQNENINKQMMARDIDFNKCVTLIPASFDKCQKQYYAEIPAKINTNAEKWGKVLGECIGGDFAVNHLIAGPSATPTTPTVPAIPTTPTVTTPSSQIPSTSAPTP